MPIYEYTCEECKHTTEAMRRMAEADEPLACEACGSERTRRDQSVFAASSGGGEEDAVPASPPCGPGGACGLS